MKSEPRSAEHIVVRRLRWLMATVVITLVALDQVVKQWALTSLDPNRPPTFLGGFFRLLLLKNPGAAFSLGSSLGSSSTVVISLLAAAALLAGIVWFAPRVRDRYTAVVLGLGLAGVGGNFVDRVFRAPGPLRGHVIDYLSFGNFPVFNIADICLTTAAGLMILGAFFPRWTTPPRSEAVAD